MGNQIGAQNVRTGPMGMQRETTTLRKENQELMLAQQSYQMGDIYGAQRHEEKAAALGLAAEAQHSKRFYSGKTVVPWAHPLVNTVAPGTGMFDTSFYNTAVPAMAPTPVGNYGAYQTVPFLSASTAGTYTPINGGFNSAGFSGLGATMTGYPGLSTAGFNGLNATGFSGLNTAGFGGLNSGLYNGTFASPLGGTTMPLGASTISAPIAGTYW